MHIYIYLQRQINIFRTSAMESISLDSNVLVISSSSLRYLKCLTALTGVC